MRSLIDRAASDRDFFRRLIEAPEEVARAEGYDASPKEILDLLGHPNAGVSVQVLLTERLSQLGGGKWL